MTQRKHWEDRLDPPVPKTHKHRPKKKLNPKRGFSKHVHQKLRLVSVDGIRPDRGEWYMCTCGDVVLAVILCEVPLAEAQELYAKNIEPVLKKRKK